MSIQRTPIYYHKFDVLYFFFRIATSFIVDFWIGALVTWGLKVNYNNFGFHIETFVLPCNIIDIVISIIFQCCISNMNDIL